MERFVVEINEDLFIVQLIEDGNISKECVDLGYSPYRRDIMSLIEFLELNPKVVPTKKVNEKALLNKYFKLKREYCNFKIGEVVRVVDYDHVSNQVKLITEEDYWFMDMAVADVFLDLANPVILPNKKYLGKYAKMKRKFFGLSVGDIIKIDKDIYEYSIVNYYTFNKVNTPVKQYLNIDEPIEKYVELI